MAVYTEISDDELSQTLAEYAIGTAVSLKPITEGIENTNYLLTTSESRYIFTVYEKRMNPTQLPFFLELLAHLESRGIPCPSPIPTKSGSYLTKIQGKSAAIVSFLEGKSARTIQNAHCQALGVELAKLHIAAASYEQTRTNDMSLPMWETLFEGVADQVDTIKHGLCVEITSHLDHLKTHWPSSDALPMGIIHADLFPDNVFFQGTTLSGLIDFYFACSDFLMYDLAITLNAWCFERGGEFNITKAKQFLSAYHATRPISTDEFKALPLLAQGAAMRFLLTRLHDWLNPVSDALVTPKNPLEYLHILRFHQGIQDPSAYGITIEEHTSHVHF